MVQQAQIAVIGAGLAGSEAAWQVARFGHRVDLFEMRPKQMTEAHKTGHCAELVCSNSFGTLSEGGASSLLKEEIGLLGSLILRLAKEEAVPAGASLAVDRDKFSEKVTTHLRSHDLINVIEGEAEKIPQNYESVIIATGPLTTKSLAAEISEIIGQDSLFFYDAISPIVSTDSLDHSKMFAASRYGKGDPDFLNIPLTREQYDEFISDLLSGDVVLPHNFEKAKYFESCMPIEVLAERGPKTLSFGPMKPVGLEDPKTGKRAHAVIQLRAENKYKTAYNLVGFQTKLKYGEQLRIFRKLPGLENAEFLRLGSLHRNTYIDSPRAINATLQLRNTPKVYVAGQLTGTEGYLESASTGLWAGMQAAHENLELLSEKTMLGALLSTISDPDREHFQPMNANKGVLPPLPEKIRDKKERFLKQRKIALDEMQLWVERNLSVSQRTSSELRTPRESLEGPFGAAPAVAPVEGPEGSQPVA